MQNPLRTVFIIMMENHKVAALRVIAFKAFQQAGQI